METAAHSKPPLEIDPVSTVDTALSAHENDTFNSLVERFSEPNSEPTLEQTSKLRRIFGKMGKGAAIRAGVELVGIGVDAALMGAGQAGVHVLRDVVTREVTATVPEIAVLDKVLPHKHEKREHNESSKLRRVAHKVGGIALGVTTAVVAQKVGVHIAHGLHANLTHGVGEFAVPITSKVSALTGLSSLRRRLK